ncbi:MAG: YcjF family protein [Planctomycetaceae bacterium]
MGRPQEFWRKAWEKFAFPTVSADELEQCFERVRRELPVPVFWLLGKTQSGKTSLIRALTENTRAEIGNGIRPCTRTAREYPFPSESDCILRFLDTRGLGEVDYDPSEDIALFQDQAHLLIVVMKALDHAQKPVMQALARIHAQRPHWPILVAQTTLHEGYVSREQRHLVPYPYGSLPFPSAVPEDLARSLLSQRQMLSDAEIEARFVPVDFTLPEDGYEPVNYGLDALWEAIEERVPLGLRNILQRHDEARKSLRDVHLRTAHPHVVAYATAAGAAATIPLPVVDIPLVIAIQAKMFHALASIYHQPFDRQQIGEVLSALGLGYLGRFGGRQLVKFIPGYGSAVSAVYSGASTYALGLTLCAYFSHVRDGFVPDKAEFRKLYQQHFDEGRERLQGYLANLRNRPQAGP